MANPTDSPLRVVVDANLVLAMFLARRDTPTRLSPKRHLMSLLPSPDFRWLWTNDIISDLDLDDAIYLACAVDGDTRLLSSQDSDLHSLGEIYEGVRIVNWAGLAEELKVCGLA